MVWAVVALVVLGGTAFAVTEMISALNAVSAANASERALEETANVLNHGVNDRATVPTVDDAHNVATGPPILSITGSYGAKEYVLRLRVRLAGRPAYVTSVDQAIAPSMADQLQPGLSSRCGPI
jgi:hypothetical protein